MRTQKIQASQKRSCYRCIRSTPDSLRTVIASRYSAVRLEKSTSRPNSSIQEWQCPTIGLTTGGWGGPDPPDFVLEGSGGVQLLVPVQCVGLPTVRNLSVILLINNNVAGHGSLNHLLIELDSFCHWQQYCFYAHTPRQQMFGQTAVGIVWLDCFVRVAWNEHCTQCAVKLPLL